MTTSTPKHTPATPLPWEQGPSGLNERVMGSSRSGYSRTHICNVKSAMSPNICSADAAYIAHAANAYPRLVAALQSALRQVDELTDYEPGVGEDYGSDYRALLRELGEL